MRSKKMIMALVMVSVFLASSMIIAIPTDETDADRLPNGYTEVEYIESNGTQYINLGEKSIKNTDRLKITFNPLGGLTNLKFLTGWNPSGPSNDNIVVYINNAIVTAQNGGNTRLTLIASLNTINALEIVNDEYRLTTTTTYTRTYTPVTEFTQTGNLYVGWATNDNNNRMFVGRIYAYEHWDSSEVKDIDLIPCISPTNEVGMYDLISNTFYGNAGTGTFTAGAVVGNTITINSNNTAYGTVSPSSVIFPEGATATVSVSDNTLTVSCPGQSPVTITATPTAATSQYTYAFGGWSVSDGATITTDTTITATFTRTLNTYTINFASSNTQYGTVSPLTLTNVPYGSVYTVNGTTITLAGETVTATAVNNAQYIGTFGGWSVQNGAIVTGDTTVTATFTGSLQLYRVDFASNNTSWGTVSPDHIDNVPYGSTVAVNGNVIVLYLTTVTAIPVEATAQYTYSFSSWDVEDGTTITGNTTITATFIATAISHTVTIVSNNTAYGTVSPSTITGVPTGATITVSNNTITINNTTVTATPTTSTAQYAYSFSSWSVSDGATVTSNMTITATFTISLQTYVVTFAVNNDEYGTVSPSSLTGVPYGSMVAVNGAVLTIYGETVTATPVDNAHYLSEFSSWDVENGAIVTGNTTVTATFTATVKTYTVTIVSNNAAYGTVSASTISSVPYGSTVTVSNNTITIGSTTVTATPSNEDSDGNTYRFMSWNVEDGTTITGNTTITATFAQITAWNPIATAKRLLWIVPLIIIILLVLLFAGVLRT